MIKTHWKKFWGQSIKFVDVDTLKLLMFGQFPEYRKFYGRSNQGALASSLPLPETCGDQILPAVAKYGRERPQKIDGSPGNHGVTTSRGRRKTSSWERSRQTRFPVTKRVKPRDWRHPGTNTSSEYKKFRGRPFNDIAWCIMVVVLDPAMI